MFEGRLKILLCLLGFSAAVMVARLAELQIVGGEAYHQVAADMLVKPPEFIPAVRGRILARQGEVLASEEPSWEICVHYGLIAEDREYLRRLARSKQVAETDLRERVGGMWRQLSRLSDLSLEEIDRRRQAIVRRVDLIRGDFERRHGYETTMLEEVTLHPAPPAAMCRTPPGDICWGGWDRSPGMTWRPTPIATILCANIGRAIYAARRAWSTPMSPCCAGRVARSS